jgi:hypothetical protein
VAGFERLCEISLAEEKIFKFIAPLLSASLTSFELHALTAQKSVEFQRQLISEKSK